MLSWLFGPNGRVPDGETIYAIGDIHGRDDLLGRLHDSIQQDIASNADACQATVIYLGDYIDRGPDSRAVLDRLLEAPVQGAKSIYLMGNHEDAMLRFLSGASGGENWLSIGGGATARSYGISLREGDGALLPEVVRQRLTDAIPHRHLSFLRQLYLNYEVGDYLFVHAGVKPGRPMDEQETSDLLWIRGEFLRSRRSHGKIIVHGHSSGRKIVEKSNRICIDTAAYATDRLSCVVLLGSQRRYIKAEL